MFYLFGMLRMDDSADAKRHNQSLLGRTTLGIEVVQKRFADWCGLGNIDPQHHQGGTSSAIERAMVHDPLPPQGSKLVTIRPDKDSIGAMAVLELRAEDRERDIDPHLVARISAMDREGYNEHNRDRLDALVYVRREVTNALNIIASNGAWPDLAAKVEAFKLILTREMPDEEVDRIALTRLPPDMSAWKMQPYGDIGYIEAPDGYRAARDWGNRQFRVAIVFDPYFNAPGTGEHPRYTIVRQQNCFDRYGFEAKMNALEAEARGISIEELKAKGLCWAGNKNICSSAQGKGNETKLSKPIILGITQECLTSGIVS